MSRLFELVYLLLDKKRLTAAELAQHFEVSKRTILRDVQALSMAGIPIYAQRGADGGISLLDNFVLDKATISDREQVQILLALESLAATQQLDASGALSKLRALFGKADSSWIAVDFSRWGNTRPDQEKFELLKLATIQRQAIAFSYPGADGTLAGRTAYPLRLVFKARGWYLQAFCLTRQDYRLFKISRMLHVALRPECFAHQTFTPPPIEPEGPPAGGLIHLRLVCSAEAVPRLYDEFGPEQVTRNADNTHSVAADLPDDRWLYGFLLSLGTTAEVLAPKEVRTRLLEQARQISAIYQKD